MRRRLFAGALALAACGLIALGVWQLQRLAWKLDLIEQVNMRVHAQPRTLRSLSDIGPEDAYLRVRVTGVFRRKQDTFVKALTERGSGWWVLTPLQTEQGVLLVNRGFVPEARRASFEAGPSPSGLLTVTGLVRTSELGGGFLRANDPAADKWFSRDVAAIARRRGLEEAAAFFVDAEATPNAAGYPIGGLTVVNFRNPHLVYALTWFVLAGLCLFGLRLLWRHEAAVRVDRLKAPATKEDVPP